MDILQQYLYLSALYKRLSKKDPFLVTVMLKIGIKENVGMEILLL